ncbi:DUF1573 domain-containing protein [uncultured Bacteroides sp.]|nr:DUF1573 domain-containing protein [uncultured Bacteroides sp.]
MDTNATVKFEEVKTKYTILHYVDTIGCVSCKLQLPKWNELIEELDSIANGDVQCLISFSPANKKGLLKSLKINRFKHYVYIDEKDSLNQLNTFPKEDTFCTFLLDGENKVVAIGNPIHNPKVKELYLKIIQGKESTESEKQWTTEIKVKESIISLGRFNWKEEKQAVFKIKNTGNRPLVINDVATSCGCTSVDYPKEPARPGDSISLRVTYKADHPEHFDKTITVYCNANPSLVRLKIMGDAE